jgi:hypothetical protein
MPLASLLAGPVFAYAATLDLDKSPLPSESY